VNDADIVAAVGYLDEVLAIMPKILGLSGKAGGKPKAEEQE
jgi:hypothetical protein